MHPLSISSQAVTGGLQPWIGWSNKKWSTLNSFNYIATEVRVYSAEDIDLYNIGAFQLANQTHRHWWKDSFSIYTGLGFAVNIPLANRASTIFTEEEQEEYDQQNIELAAQIKSTSVIIPFGIQYWINDSLYVGIRQDFYNSFSIWRSETVGSQLTTTYFSENQIQVGCFF